SEPEGSNLVDEKLKALATRVPSVEPALRSYVKQAHDEFNAEHDHLRLLGQDNLRRYRPIERLCICLHTDDTKHEIAARLGAAHGFDEPFVFDSIDRFPLVRGDEDAPALARAMSRALFSYARNGDPGWPCFGAEALSKSWDSPYGD
ncbi:MAG: hypothetical protein ABGW90_09220, partial [Martelella sp.]